VRNAVNEQLVRLEARERGYAELPEIKAAAQRQREDLMESILYAEHVFKDVKVSDEELRAWFDAHEAELQLPERRMVDHIVVATEDEARAVLQRMEQGESFEDLAKELSKDRNSARSGGALGWVTPKDVPPEFQAVLALAEGGLSEPIRSRYGWHVLRVGRIEPPRMPPFEEAKEGLREKVLLHERKAERERWLAQLRAAAEIEIDEAAVKAFAAETAPKQELAPPDRDH
jgi:peptidyl-prolyl cis-trans isomerase C/foldase protein PrsA